ncbi:hypothetical protein [Subtercola boreus]|uniref:hypothetical protein n=1 Tax=Subtercola boreus TaxID=120213 RepID=UPI0011C0591D|nr:hypothetical protein [Subtercola boreus]
MAAWLPFGGVRVGAVCVPTRPSRNGWGVVVTFAVEEACGPIDFRVRIDPSIESGWCTGQGLAAIAYGASGVTVYVGGPDEGVANWLPAVDRALPVPVTGLGWRITGAAAGETIERHCAIAWGHGETGEYEAWTAVDTRVDLIRRAQ